MTSEAGKRISESGASESLGDETGAKRSNGDAPAVGYELLGADSEREPVISVVMPTLNEEDGIRECIERVQNALVELELPGEVIISDSSTDRTPDIAREMGAIVVEPDEPGYGYAYRYAFDHARGEYIVIGDADTTYDFEQIPKLLEPVRNGEADMCMGSRLEGEIKPGAMPALHEHVGNPLLTKFLNVFYGAGVSDAHSGFRVIHRDALETLEVETDGMEFASEMIMEAGARDLTIAERPIVYHEREGEATLDSFRDGWRHVRFMLMNAPGYLFTGPGLAMVLLGAVLMGLSMLSRSISGVFFGTHTVIAGSLLTIVGYQVTSLSLFSSVATNPIRMPADPVTDFIKDRFRLEHGATLGVGVLLVGAVYSGMSVLQWASVGYAQPPEVVPIMIGFTGVVLGLQTIFYSFFLSMLAQR